MTATADWILHYSVSIAYMYKTVQDLFIVKS